MFHRVTKGSNDQISVINIIGQNMMVYPLYKPLELRTLVPRLLLTQQPCSVILAWKWVTSPMNVPTPRHQQQPQQLPQKIQPWIMSALAVIQFLIVMMMTATLSSHYTQKTKMQRSKPQLHGCCLKISQPLMFSLTNSFGKHLWLSILFGYSLQGRCSEQDWWLSW